MSNVAEQIDPKTSQIQWLHALSSFYVKDINALPDDQMLVSPGGCARSAQSITGEVIGLCGYATALLRGEEPVVSEAGPDMAGLDTGAKLGEAVQKATNTLADAIAGADEEVWGKTVTPPWQMPDTVRNIVNIAINHIWYHDGQINTYQCLLGDDKVHWMD